MVASAAISGDYTDLRFIKGRKVCAITIEIPIEAAEDFVRAFGTPRPAEGVPVALARMMQPKAEEPARERRKMEELALPVQAALLCDREAFQRFMRERLSYRNVSDVDTAAEALREWCNVKSRSELLPGTDAASLFFKLKGEFDVWMRAPA
jgi:hypothetical protein